MHFAYKLNKQGDNIQPWRTPFPIWNQSVVPCPVLTLASWPAYKFLKRQARWSGIPISFRIFQFVVIHTVKGFGIVNKAKVDVFLELFCFFHDSADVGNLISGSSAFSKKFPVEKPQTSQHFIEDLKWAIPIYIYFFTTPTSFILNFAILTTPSSLNSIYSFIFFHHFLCLITWIHPSSISFSLKPSLKTKLILLLCIISESSLYKCFP